MKMSSGTSKKRKLCSPSAESNPAKKKALRHESSSRRISARLKENSPSLMNSPERICSPSRSPSTPRKKPLASKLESRPTRASPLKASVQVGSFYSKQKPLYLTPLERKVLNETKSPPSNQDQPSAPLSSGGNVVTKKPKKKKVRAQKSNLKGYFVPETSQRTNPDSSTNTVEVKKQPMITFGRLKSKTKPRIVVSAAFFCSGTKSVSMYKPNALKPKSKQTSSGKPATEKATAPAQRARSPVRQAVFLQKSKPNPQLLPKPENGGASEDTELAPHPQPLSSNSLSQTTEINTVMTRKPHSPVKCLQSNTDHWDTSVDPGSDPVLDISEIGTSSNSSCSDHETSAMYPIFGSKRSQTKRRLTSPLDCSTPSAGTPRLVKERRSRRKKELRKQSKDDQLIIDAGQKQFGATTCNSCGMLYSTDSPEDNFQHTQFHQHFLESIKFVGWKKERVVSEFWDGKIILVLPEDPKYATKKAEDVRRIADSELGFQQVNLSSPSAAKTYLFINSEKMVVGCLVAEPIRQAFRVLAQTEETVDKPVEDFMERHRTWCCSTTPEKAICGVSRIWVFSMMRRKGIATRLLDTARGSFMYGSPLTKEEIAFSDPTPDGKLFAMKYCGSPRFLVYNFIG